MFDLSSLDTAVADDGGIWLPITHPKTGEPLSLEFRVRSKNSDAVRAKAKRYISRLQTDRDFREKGKVDLDVAEAHSIDTLVLCTVDWRDCADVNAAVKTYRPEICINKEWIPFSAAKAREIYAHHGWSWLRAQVQAASEDEANFLPSGETSFANTPSTSSPSPVQPIRATAVAEA